MILDGRLSITAVAKQLGVTTKTITRWEKAGKVKRPNRDWRGEGPRIDRAVRTFGRHVNQQDRFDRHDTRAPSRPFVPGAVKNVGGER